MARIAQKENYAMNAAKVKAHQIIDQLPDDCTASDILYRMYVVSKIDCGLENIKNGEVLSHAQVMKELHEWLATSSGPKKAAKI